MSDKGLQPLAQDVLATLRAKGLKVATAESCTGGLVAGALTAIGGSSDVVERGWVTYSNEAKLQELGVPPDTIETHGAVSEEVARAMAEGAVMRAPVDIAVSVTGIAGPGGATANKPVGLVFIGCARRTLPTLVRVHNFTGDRAEIRQQSVAAALHLVKEQAAR